jgi:Hemerythrin HHE cation binding domain
MPRVAARTTRRKNKRTALDVLKADHAEAKKLFKLFERFRKTEDSDGMRQAAQAACKALRTHAQIEEEIFYPALREGADASDALDEADVEHSHIKELVGQLEASLPGDYLFAARFTVLSEYVQHHVEEEESTIFSKARKAECDLVALGAQLIARKEELVGGEESVPGALARRGAVAPHRNGQRVTR